MGCASSQDAPPGSPTTWRGATILIGIDGLRWDYPEHIAMPGFDSIGNRGVRAAMLSPVFPSKTFPNLYAMVTGLYPQHSGIVDNTMYDPAWDARFRIGDTLAVRDGRWWEGEPIWVTAGKQRRRTATFFWPGSEAEIKGYRPTYWEAYDGSVPGQQRVDQVLAWLNLPPAARPHLVLLYFSSVDDAGHRYGPGAMETVAAVKETDALLESLVSGLRRQGILDDVNIVIVSDHGMSERSEDRIIFVDDYIDTRTAGILSLGESVTFWPQPEAVEVVYSALTNAHPELKVYLREDLPARYHLFGHRRTPPIVAVPTPGWTVSTHDAADRLSGQFSGGAHGYDNAETDMQGVFAAAGPAFRSAVRIDTIRAVDVYNLLAQALGVDPAPNDGDASLIQVLLNRPQRLER